MIRPATSDDAAAVSELEEQLFGPDAWSYATTPLGCGTFFLNGPGLTSVITRSST